MWPRDAYVGQRVVCIDSDWGPYEATATKLGCKLPTENTVYTIREIVAVLTDVGIRLEEIVNPKVSEYGRYEPFFNAEQFKPVDESRLDVFRELLEPVHADA